MTSQWRHYCFGGLDLSEAPLQESVAMATARDLHSHFYLLANSYIFSGKVTKFGWITFLPRWVMGKNLKGGAEHHPEQDRVIGVNPSFTKPFGTHTFYQGGGGSSQPPAISKTVAPMNVKFWGY